MRQKMFAGLIAATVLLSALPGAGQERVSVFEDYAAFDSFVTDMVNRRAFGALLQRMGGGDRLTLADVQRITEQSRQSFPQDFENSDVLRKQDLGNGFSQEARAFWVGETYAFVYILLHERDDGLVVVNFAIHASPAPVLSMF
ncbi:hypothetical protein [Tropicimonas aquimaris]|uniref:DUF3887 domain-containing protein n=1 Tax=Tropicimonas aquimaris TaxID=914152 RepID=A0ABW3IT07_9RHOB